MHKYYLIATLCLLIILLISCKAPSDTVPDSQPVSVTSKAEPYKFELGEVVISPTEVEAASPIKVEVPVKNIGSEANYYRATLTVGKDYGETRDIMLKPGESGVLKYDLILNEAGTYVLSVADFSGTIKVYRAVNYKMVFPGGEEISGGNQPSTLFHCTAPVYPFFIRNISFRHAPPRSVSILDNANIALYTNNAPSMSMAVPYIQVMSDFTIKLMYGFYRETIPPPAWDNSGWGRREPYYITHYTEVESIDGIQKRYTP